MGHHPRLCASPSETGSDHLHVIAEEVSRVAELCVEQEIKITLQLRHIEFSC
jgi:hypothetical protein